MKNHPLRNHIDGRVVSDWRDYVPSLDNLIWYCVGFLTAVPVVLYVGVMA